MPSDTDWCHALNEFVEAVYECTSDDPEWTYKYTQQSKELREEMIRAVNKLAIGLLGRPLLCEELNIVFDWDFEC